jgi:hypothetical protein
MLAGSPVSELTAPRIRAILEPVMVRPLVAAMIALGLVGCGKQLNPEYCAANPNDTDCRGHDLVMIDAPQGCMSNAMCTTDPAKAVCELDTGNCVQCVPGGDTSACTTATGMLCGQDRLCHGCLVDTDCSSLVCLPTGMCAAESDVLYASPMGGGNCGRLTPCTFTEAVAMLTATKKTIKLTTTISGTDYSDPPITIDKPALIIGTGTTLTPTGSGPAITVDTAAVEIMGITVSGATTDGIACTKGTLTLRRAILRANTGYGVHTTGCDATIERCKLTLNTGGGMFIDDGTFEIRNNFVGPTNGNTNLQTGAIRLNKGKGRVVFNTVAKNLSEQGGGARVGAMSCAASGGFTVVHNIFVANGAANNEVGGDCTYMFNYVGHDNDFGLVKFVSLTDFHLTAQSPTGNPILIREDPDADKDCRVNGVDGAYIDDIDGQARPNGLCDRGADEYLP